MNKAAVRIGISSMSGQRLSILLQFRERYLGQVGAFRYKAAFRCTIVGKAIADCLYFRECQFGDVGIVIDEERSSFGVQTIRQQFGELYLLQRGRQGGGHVEDIGAGQTQLGKATEDTRQGSVPCPAFVVIFQLGHDNRTIYKDMRQTDAILYAVVRGGAVGDFAGGKGGDGLQEVRQSTRGQGSHRVVGRHGGGVLEGGIGGRGVVGATAVEVGVDRSNGCAQG